MEKLTNNHKMSRKRSLHKIAVGYFNTVVGSKHLQALTNTETSRVSEVKYKRFVGLLVLISLCCISAFAISEYKSEVKTGLPSHVVDLTKERVKWDLYIGESNSCGEIPCHLTESLPASKFHRQIVLPGREFPVVGYNPKSKSKIYYRTRIRIPENLINQQETLKLHTLFVWAKTYRFYINERLVETGERESLFITIPKESIRYDGTVFLSVVVDPEGLAYQGISNYGNMAIGTKSSLAPQLRVTYDLQYTYPLWFLVPRVALCILFCFLFIVIRQNPEAYAFILFGFAGVIKFMFLLDYNGNYTPSHVDSRWVYQLIYPLEQFLLLGFVQKFFRKSDRTFNIFYRTGITILFSLLILGLVTGRNYIDTGLLILLPRAIRFITVTYGLYLAIETTLYLAWTQKSEHRLNSCLSLVVFFIFATIGITVDITNILPAYYRGFMNYTLELVLFVFFASITALDFGGVIKQRDSMDKTLKKTMGSKLKDAYLMRGGALPAELKTVSILFSDIRGFSDLSGHLKPREVQEFLNHYFSLMNKVIERNHGRIDKTIGDAVMAVWGAPSDDPNHAFNAAKAAIEMRAALQELNTERKTEGKFTVAIGIGIHTGRVVAGEIGGEERADYTIIGDDVNIAARVESSTKHYKTDIIFSDAVYDIVKDKFICSPVGEMDLKGIRRKIEGYKVIAIANEEGFKTYCHTFDKLITENSKPGLIKDCPPNLDLIDYDKLFAA
jgi:class 3 adenylate cyclase